MTAFKSIPTKELLKKLELTPAQLRRLRELLAEIEIPKQKPDSDQESRGRA